MKYYKQPLAKTFNKKASKEIFIELLKYQENEKYIDEFKKFEIPVYSIKFKDVLNVLQDKLKSPNNALSKVVHEKLRNLWVESNFKLSRDELLEVLKLEQFLEQCKLEYENNKKKLKKN